MSSSENSARSAEQPIAPGPDHDPLRSDVGWSPAPMDAAAPPSDRDLLQTLLRAVEGLHQRQDESNEMFFHLNERVLMMEQRGSRRSSQGSSRSSHAGDVSVHSA